MDNAPTSPMPRNRRPLRPFVCGIAAGVLAAVVIGFVLLVVFLRGTTPLLTEADLTAAVERWNARGPKSYRLRLAVTGVRGGSVELEVRDGEPVQLTRDGRTPARHTWDFWTVPGQFEAIQSEMTGDPQAMFGVPDRSSVVQRGEFDPQFGYPRKYERYVLGKSLEVGWEVLSFEPLD